MATSMGKQSKLDADRILERAVEFFGEGGFGLDVAERAEQRLLLEGGGGFVAIEVTPTRRRTDVRIASSEWDYQVKQFLAKI